MSPKEINETARALFKEHKDDWKKGPRLVVDEVWKSVEEPKRGELRQCREAATVRDHWWVPKLVWWVRQQAALETEANPTDADDTVEHSTTRWEATKKDGTVETLTATHADGTPIMAHRFRTSMNPGEFIPDSLRVEPPYAASGKSTLRDKLSLRVSAVALSRSGPDSASDPWDRRVKKHLQRGLPAIAHVKSGRYLREGMEAGGHYVLIVGFRETDGVLRFIVNDPAGAKKLQYECFRETDVVPTETEREYLTSLEVSFTVSRDGTELGAGSTNFEEAELGAALTGSYPERQIPLAGLGSGMSVNLTFEGGASAPKTTNFSEFRYSAEIVSNEISVLTASRRSAEAKRKKGEKTKRVGAASHSEDSLTVELTFTGGSKRKKGTRLPRPWEDQSNGLVERRRHDSLVTAYLLEPTYPWEEGAAQWLVYHGETK